MVKSFEGFLNEIDNSSIPEEHKITMNQAKAIINHNDRSIYGSVHEAFKLGYLIAQQQYGKKVSI
jgi:hypothetical protein